jgi:protein TonB
MTDTTHSNHNLPMQDDAPRKSATPLLWLLLVLALVAFAWWYLANRSASYDTTGYDTTQIGDSTRQAAEAEPGVAATPATRATASRTTARSTPRPARSSTATRTPANRSAELLPHAQPRYPVAQQRRGVEGNVTLRITVDANGVPSDITYASRSGSQELDRAALLAARDWRFRPATRGGEAVASTVDVPVNFRL